MLNPQFLKCVPDDSRVTYVLVARQEKLTNQLSGYRSGTVLYEYMAGSVIYRIPVTFDNKQ